MEGQEAQIATQTLLRLFLVLLYAPIGCYACARLFPRLAPGLRLVAALLLLGQILIIGMALEYQPLSQWEEWLWHLNAEGNIAAAFASTQLALASGAALLAARRPSGRWHRRYLGGMALLFLFLAGDEYMQIHETLPAWEIVYAALGAAVVMATLMAARGAPAEARRWHVCLLAGLAISGVAAVFVEQLKQPAICAFFGDVNGDGCLWRYFVEEPLELLGIWLALLAMLGLTTELRLSKPVARFLLGWSFLWLLLLCLWSLAPGLELRLMTEPANVRFGSGTELHGYRVERRKHELFTHLIVSARQADYPWLGYSVVLVDQVTGAELARRDRFSRGQLLWHLGADWRHVFRETIPVLLPAETPENRAYWIVLTQWREREGLYTTQSVEASDLPRLTETQIIIGEYLRPEPSNKGILDPLARFSNGFALVQADLPASAKAGDKLAITFRWQAEAAGVDDLIQFLHLGHSESGAWHVTDQQPLGARLPTRLWYTGLDDSETWQLPLPEDLAAGEYQVFTGLYRHSDGERLPAFDSDGGSWLDNRVALGNLIVE